MVGDGGGQVLQSHIPLLGPLKGCRPLAWSIARPELPRLFPPPDPPHRVPDGAEGGGPPSSSRKRGAHA